VVLVVNTRKEKKKPRAEQSESPAVGAFTYASNDHESRGGLAGGYWLAVVRAQKKKKKLKKRSRQAKGKGVVLSAHTQTRAFSQHTHTHHHYRAADMEKFILLAYVSFHSRIF
jgi:hypothetical protein